ncbi:uncharacterized protein LOC143538116 [Bidens hawaiensis]|uniref:uncharacterized protein LOC143538116 n=1 Tax=Bidens hawaiensis TaxID=980011 RepID=UPI0040496D1B
MAPENSEKSKADGEAIDHQSPYYIHASDYPKQLHVNDVLRDNNYNDWAQEMTNFLFAKNKIGFVDGSIKKPKSNSTLCMPWMRADAMIKGWLTTTMENDIRNSVKCNNTACEIWTNLQERFGKKSAPRAYELKQSLTVTQQDGTSVTAYFTKLKGLWDEIESVLPPLISLVMVVCAEYPTPNLNVAFHLVYEDEQQRQITIPRKPSKEAAAFQASFP